MITVNFLNVQEHVDLMCSSQKIWNYRTRFSYFENAKCKTIDSSQESEDKNAECVINSKSEKNAKFYCLL